MSLCPVCKNIISDSFGIVQCPSCKTMLIAEFDGTLRVQDEDSMEKSQMISKHEAEENFKPHEVEKSGEWGDENKMESSEESYKANDVVKSLENENLNADFFINNNQEVRSDQLKQEAIENVLEFAESKNSNLPEGEFIYTLYCTEVLTQDLRIEVLECLKDQRLSISSENILQKSNEIQITGLNPIKLTVIINKIKSLPIQIRWSQSSLTQ